MENSSRFISDQPISSSKQDALNRAGFAKRLASAVRSVPGADSLVIGLYGDWGVGKSSIMRMAIEALQEHGEGCPIILEFNPWRLTDDNQLASSFFSEIGKKLREEFPEWKEEGSEAQSRVRAWDEYSRYLSFGSAASKSLSTVLALAGIPVGPLIEAIGKIAGSTSDLAKHGKDAAQFVVDEERNSLEDLHQELRGFFSDKLERNFLVVIDDIDRLSQSEVRMLIRLIKANVDFPRFIFLLLCDDAKVAKALEKDFGEKEGSAYLEKIVQVPFRVPSPNQSDLSEYFFRQLNQLLERFGAVVWNQERDNESFQELYHPGLKPYLTSNIRSINRYLNCLSLSISSYIENNTLNVNIVDLMALEAIRVYEPEVYRRLPDCKMMLTSESDSWDSLTSEEVEKQKSHLVDAASSKDRIKPVLGFLFPVAFSGTRYGSGFHSAWRDQLRLCSPEMFDRYLEFEMRSTDLPQSQLERLVANADNEEVVVSVVGQLAERGLLNALVERLDSAGVIKKIDDPVLILTELWNNAAKIGPRHDMMLPMDGFDQLRFLLTHFLSLVGDPARRDSLVVDLVGRVKDLASIASIDQRFSKRDSEVGSLVSDATMDSVRETLIERIQVERENGSLLDLINDRTIIFWRWIAAEREEAVEFVRNAIRSPEGLMALFKANSGTSSNGKKTMTYVHLKGIEELLSLEDVDQALEEVEDLPEDSEIMLWINRYKFVRERRKLGKSEDPINFEDDAW